MDLIIAACPRSGSSLLCQLLAANGLGAPDEHLRPWSGGAFVEAIQRNESAEDYLERIRPECTQNGIFATKVFAEWCDAICCHMRGGPTDDWHSGIQQLFPDAVYLFLCRRNVFAQAVSYCRAQRSGEWFRLNNSPISTWRDDIPVEDIHETVLRILAWEEMWLRHFRMFQRKYLCIGYEQLEHDAPAVLQEIFAFLGLPSGAPPACTPSLLRQRDEHSQHCLDTYLESGLFQRLFGRLRDAAAERIA